MDNAETEYLIRINYRSGHSLDLWFKEFRIKITSSMSEVEYTLADEHQRILFFGLDDVESVVQLDTRIPRKYHG